MRSFRWLCWGWLIGSLAAQDADVFVGSELYSWWERWDVRGYVDTVVPIESRPWGREEMRHLLAHLDTSRLHRLDKARYQRAVFWLLDSLPTRQTPSFLRWAFPNRRDLFVWEQPYASLYIGPLVQVAAGRDSSGLLYQNTRGAYLRARLGRKVGLYADFLETQARPPFFITQRYSIYQTLWGEAFVKPFRSNAYDYTNTRGYLTYSPVPAVRLKFGRDKAFWGPGFQSLYLSDYPPEYLYLHLRTRLGRWEYHNFFAQLIDYLPNKPDSWGDQPRKYLALHQLLWRPRRGVCLGLFEGILYNPWTPRGYRGFELTYLVPVIFYRAVEQALGSPDNAMMGVFWRANLLRRFQVYGQLAIDDYNFGKRKEGRGWWGNKYAYQVGFKAFDVGVSTLDLQFELNQVQPYTYSHSNVGAAWTHHDQFLAHPYGANLREVVGLVRYQPVPGLILEGRITWLQQGQNTPTQNWGSSPFQTDITHVQDFGNRVLQGQRQTYRLVHGRLSWQPWCLPLYLEGEGFWREGQQGGWITLRWMVAPKPLRW